MTVIQCDGSWDAVGPVAAWEQMGREAESGAAAQLAQQGSQELGRRHPSRGGVLRTGAWR